MANELTRRWFHSPRLRQPSTEPDRTASWLEMFYDLVVATALVRVGTAYATDITPTTSLIFVLILVAVCQTWMGFAFYSNRFVVDDVLHRGLVFVQLFIVVVIAAVLPDAFRGDMRPFMLAHGAARCVLVALHVRNAYQADAARDMCRRYAIGFSVGALLWLSSGLFGVEYWPLLATLAIIVDFSTPLNRASRELALSYPLDTAHLSERYGVFTVILLASSFLAAVTHIGGQHGVWGGLLMGGLCLVVAISIWWIYFDDIAGSRLKSKRMAAFVWVYAHLPFAASITLMAVGIRDAAQTEFMTAVPTTARLLLSGGLAVLFASVGLIDSVTERRQAELSDASRVRVRLISALLFALLIPIGRVVAGWVFLALVAGVCIAQVLFDLSMAPEVEAVGERPDGAPTRAPAGSVARAPQAGRIPDAGEAVRRGTPNELRRDMYYHLMEGSWLQVFAAISAAFLAINVVFAGLYMLQPASIENMAATSFVDAFSFSVQTMSTIGYGGMSPATTYGHVVVTIEAFVGLLSVALATGLLFAKASRPRSSVLFSKPVLIVERDGKRTLTFRVGNARGNDVVEASIRVVLLLSERSPTGEEMRRFHDVKLQRESSPLFVLSWTVFHDIDEGSPFFGLDVEDLVEDRARMIVTLVGYDSTYAQTTHARHMYDPLDFRVNERFVDVITTLDDGRIAVDYGRFHDTQPV